MASRLILYILAAVTISFAAAATGQQGSSEAELATKLNNPVSSLISVPFQFNWDHEFGPEREGHRFQLNVQPVVPIKLNADWNLIARVIVPIVDQHIPQLGDGGQTGIGDITGEFFFTPSARAPGGIIWGIGPAILIPTGTDFISADKWALGPAAVVLKQASGWTYGALVDHLWSVGGGGRQNISNTFLQPFVSYTTKDACTISLNAESSYDWRGAQWTVPLNASVSKLTKVGTQPLSLGVSARYYADSPSAGPNGWGARWTVTVLFPEG